MDTKHSEKEVSPTSCDEESLPFVRQPQAPQGSLPHRLFKFPGKKYSFSYLCRILRLKLTKSPPDGVSTLGPQNRSHLDLISDVHSLQSRTKPSFNSDLTLVETPKVGNPIACEDNSGKNEHVWITSGSPSFASSKSAASRSLAVASTVNAFCKLCLSFVPMEAMHQLRQCHCNFCSACLRNYVTAKIREGDAMIECPDSECECNGTLSNEEIESLVGKELLGLHSKFRWNREVDLDPFKIWCPRPGCETVVSLSVSRMEGKPQCSSCPNCKASFCTSCAQPWHSGKPCLSYIASHEISFMDSVKVCPRCSVYVLREGGCAQVQCIKCKHVFCWYCLTSLENDYLLKHFFRGPCRGRLEHNRVHLTCIIVGAFVCFLIAAPSLILIAPCLLLLTNPKIRRWVELNEDEPVS